MKRTFTFLLASVASTLVANAQTAITIDSSDVAIIGKSIIMASDTSSTVFNPGPSGANQTWNFTNAVAGTKDTVTFSSPAGSPYAANFPNANVYASSDSSYIYLRKTGTALFIDGSAFASLGVFDANPDEQMIAFPSTMGTTFNNTSKFSVTLPTGFPIPGPDSLRTEQTKTKTSTVDAWGTITTPGGTYTVIRVKSVAYTVDSSFMHIPGMGWQFDQATPDTGYTYDWWAKGQSYPVMSLDSSSFGVFATFLLPMVNGIDEASSLNAMLYPNPVHNTLHIRTQSAKLSVVIYDMKGSVVRQHKDLNGSAELSVADLTAGLYIYSITDENGKASRGTFQVKH